MAYGKFNLRSYVAVGTDQHNHLSLNSQNLKTSYDLYMLVILNVHYIRVVYCVLRYLPPKSISMRHNKYVPF